MYKESVKTGRRDFLRTSICTLAGSSLSMVGGFSNVSMGEKVKETGKPRKTQDGKRPNVLIIMTDQQAGESMSFEMGRISGNYLNTPNMDRICAEGVAFNQAYCANPLCLPSRTSMLSGRYPHETGVQNNAPDDADRERVRSLPSLGRIFRQAGYKTGYIGKFHTPYDHQKEFEYTANMRANGADPRMLEPTKSFLKEQKDSEHPFFLVTSFNNPHNICEWARGDRGEDLPDGAVYDPPLHSCPPLRTNHKPPRNEIEIMEFMRRSYHATDMTPVADFSYADWRKLQWGYYRMVEIVDRRIGNILEALRQSGHEQNTLVVFLSDHGEGQGAHEWNQKTVFFDESTRVPFAFHWPGVIDPGIRNQLVQTGIDLMPTLCGLADINPPENLPGIDLTDVIMRNDSIDREYIVSSTHFIQGAPVNGTERRPRGRMVRSRRFKYCIYSEGEIREELYDMLNDPGEMKNLAQKTDYRDIVKQHKEYLTEHCHKHGDDFFELTPEEEGL